MKINNVLFDDITDFVKYVPNVVSGLDFEKVKLNCINANNKHILKLIDESILSNTDENIKEYLKHAQANYAVFEMTRIANTILTKQGSMSIESEKLKANFGDKQDTLSFYAETGDTYIDLLLVLLKKNNIENSKQVSTTFFSSLEEFEEYKFLAGSHRTFIALLPYLTKVEKLFIIPRLGTELQNVLTSSSLVSLREAIRGYVANTAVLSAIPHLKLRYSEGITVSTFISSMQAKFDKNERETVVKSIQKDIDDYSERLEQELNKLFYSESPKFENKIENKGWSF